jgi:hypothetical protein
MTNVGGTIGSSVLATPQMHERRVIQVGRLG